MAQLSLEVVEVNAQVEGPDGAARRPSALCEDAPYKPDGQAGPHLQI